MNTPTTNTPTTEPAGDAGPNCAPVVGSAPLLDDPTHAGRWLVETDEGGRYEADVREYAPGCFEALVHGYAWDWHPTVCLHRLTWTPLPNTEARNAATKTNQHPTPNE